MNTLTLYYCGVCEAVNNFFKKLKPKTDWKVYKELNNLTDRELNDIGIGRSDILHVARGGKLYRGRV